MSRGCPVEDVEDLVLSGISSHELLGSKARVSATKWENFLVRSMSMRPIALCSVRRHMRLFMPRSEGMATRTHLAAEPGNAPISHPAEPGEERLTDVTGSVSGGGYGD